MRETNRPQTETDTEKERELNGGRRKKTNELVFLIRVRFEVGL